jgi:excisionase family DNA binding protein
MPFIQAPADQQKVNFDIYTRLLTKREIAEINNRSPRTIDNMIQARVIPYLKLGRSVRFRLADVQKALNRYLVKEVAL